MKTKQLRKKRLPTNTDYDDQDLEISLNLNNLDGITIDEDYTLDYVDLKNLKVSEVKTDLNKNSLKETKKKNEKPIVKSSSPKNVQIKTQTTKNNEFETDDESVDYFDDGEDEEDNEENSEDDLEENDDEDDDEDYDEEEEDEETIDSDYQMNLNKQNSDSVLENLEKTYCKLKNNILILILKLSTF